MHSCRSVTRWFLLADVHQVITDSNVNTAETGVWVYLAKMAGSATLCLMTTFAPAKVDGWERTAQSTLTIVTRILARTTVLA